MSNDAVYKRFHFIKAFSRKECEAILALDEEFEPSLVQTDPNNFVQKPVRTSSTKYVHQQPSTLWLFKKLEMLVTRVNQIFQFEISGLSGTQIIRYQTEQFYDWHSDLGPGVISNRKLSLIILLSPQDSYQGGTIKWMPNFKDYTNEQGTIIIFPSYIPHKVEPVTEGVRHVLVTWAIGEKSFR